MSRELKMLVEIMVATVLLTCLLVWALGCQAPAPIVQPKTIAMERSLPGEYPVWYVDSDGNMWISHEILTREQMP